MAKRLKSGIKRHKQSLERRIRNRHVRATVKTAVKDVRQAVAENRLENIQEVLSGASSTIAKAGAKGILHRKTAARKVARLARAVYKASQAAPKQ